VNFTVLPTRIELEAQDDLELPEGGEANLFRGALGAALRRICGCEECRGREAEGEKCWYRRLFKPRWPEGPSGYRDAPRPFVLRWRRGDLSVTRAQTIELNLFLFEPDNALWGVFEQAFKLAGARGLGPKRTKLKLIRLERLRQICLPVDGEPVSGNLRVEFTTPTELKYSAVVLDRPQFAPLINRLAERVHALGSLYQGWPEGTDYGDLLTCVQEVKLADWQWQRQDSFRRSSSNGHIHSIGGFKGWAEYSGPVGRFLPLLEIGYWTGVGRQTVWGKGEIRVSNFTPY
jgi:hypothetical protein